MGVVIEGETGIIFNSTLSKMQLHYKFTRGEAREVLQRVLRSDEVTEAINEVLGDEIEFMQNCKVMKKR